MHCLKLNELDPDALPQVKQAKPKRIKEALKSISKEDTQKKLSAVVEMGDNT